MGERDLSIGAAGEPMISDVSVGSELTADPDIEARVNAGYQRLVERIVKLGVYYNEFFPDGFSFSPEPDQLTQVRIALDTAFGNLTERETRILVLRNGLDGEDPKTLPQIGAVLDRPVTRERVRQIEVKAMRKLRRPSSGVGSMLAEMLGKERVV